MTNSIQWIVSIVIAVFAIIQTWRIYSLSTRRRSLILGYRDNWKFSNNNLPYDIKSSYNNNSYDNLLFINIEISNLGDSVLTKDDFSTPIIIKSSSEVKIIDFQIIEGDTVNHSFELRSINGSNSYELFEIKFNRLPKMEKFKFNVLCETTDLSTKLEFDFVYTNQIKNDKMDSVNLREEEMIPRHSPWEALGLLLIVGYFALYYYSFIYTQRFSFYLISQNLGFVRESSEIISFFIALIPPLVLISVTIFLIVRSVKGKKQKLAKSKNT